MSPISFRLFIVDLVLCGLLSKDPSPKISCQSFKKQSCKNESIRTMICVTEQLLGFIIPMFSGLVLKTKKKKNDEASRSHENLRTVSEQ